MHKHTHINTYIHIYIQTYLRTYVHGRIQASPNLFQFFGFCALCVYLWPNFVILSRRLVTGLTFCLLVLCILAYYSLRPHVSPKHMSLAQCYFFILMLLCRSPLTCSVIHVALITGRRIIPISLSYHSLSRRNTCNG